MGPVETRERLLKLFVAACEQVVRDVFKSDGIGEPSAEMIRATRDGAVENFNTVFDLTSAMLGVDACESMGTFSDDELTAMFADGARPKILEALAPLRNL